MAEINTNLDTTPLPPNNLVAKDPQSAELAGYVRTKTFGREVREAIARSIELNSARSKSAEELANETLVVTETATTNMDNQVELIRAEKDAVIANATVDSEVILARGGKPTLQARLDETTAQLAETSLLVIANGVDDTATIQNAFNTGKNIIFEREKVYTISDNLVPSDNTNINLNGSTIVVNRVVNGVHFPFDLSYKENVHIHNGTLDANVVNQHIDNCNAIYGGYAKNCLIEKMTILNYGISESKALERGDAYGTGVSFSLSSSNVDSDCYGNIVRDCIFDAEFASFAIRFSSPWHTTTIHENYNNHAYNNTILSSGKSAIEISGLTTHSCSAKNNYIKEAQLEGIDIDKGASNCVVAENFIQNVIVPKYNDVYSTNYYGAIGCHGNVANDTGRDNKIINNTIVNSYTTAVYNTGSNNTLISGNTLKNGKVCIAINGFVRQDGTNSSDGVTVTNNKAENVEKMVHIERCGNVEISNNYVRNCTKQFIYMGNNISKVDILYNVIFYNPQLDTKTYCIQANGAKGDLSIIGNNISLKNANVNAVPDDNLTWISGGTAGNIIIKDNIVDGGGLVARAFTIYGGVHDNIIFSGNIAKNMKNNLSHYYITYTMTVKYVRVTDNIGVFLDSGVTITGEKLLSNNMPTAV